MALDTIPLLIGVGAVLGALSRYYLTLWSTQRWGDRLPLGTFMINLSGTFALGFAVEILAIAGHHSGLGALVMTGFLGAYTTFSTYTLESFSLYKKGQTIPALIYWLGSPILGWVGIELGLMLGRSLLRTIS